MILDAMTYSIIAIVAVMSLVVVRLAIPAERCEEDSEQ
jgi:hypothetical protein